MLPGARLTAANLNSGKEQLDPSRSNSERFLIAGRPARPWRTAVYRPATRGALRLLSTFYAFLQLPLLAVQFVSDLASRWLHRQLQTTSRPPNVRSAVTVKKNCRPPNGCCCGTVDKYRWRVPSTSIDSLLLVPPLPPLLLLLLLQRPLLGQAQT